MVNIKKEQLIGVSPNSKLLKEYKNSLQALSSVQWEASIGLILGDRKFYSTDDTKNSRINNNIKLNRSKRLTQSERSQFSLPKELFDILIGLLLGDLCAQKPSIKANTFFRFEQGSIHKDYLIHLFNLFYNYCNSEPKTSERLPDKRTGKIYSRIQFNTYALPCFNQLYNLFYPEGKKKVPLNIGELLNPLGLAYWICDDGYYDKKGKRVLLSTDSYTLAEVELLLEVLNTKFNLIAYANKHGTEKAYVLAISAKSVSNLQILLQPIMANIMKYKLGLE